MPSKSKKQERFMRAVAHGWSPDRVDAPPLSVAREYMEADQRIRKALGGPVRMAAGGRTYTPLENDAAYMNYGETDAGEHMFFSGQIGSPLSRAPEPPAPRMPYTPPAAPYDPTGIDAMQDLANIGVPITEVSGSRIDPNSGGQPWAGGGPLSGLRDMFDLGLGEPDLMSPGATVGDFVGPQYSFDNPYAQGVLGMIPGMPDEIGFNNPFSVSGRARSQPLNLTDFNSPYNPAGAMPHIDPSMIQQYLQNMGIMRGLDPGMTDEDLWEMIQMGGIAGAGGTMPA